jgi:Fe-S-cluster-containing hydrogenase component 2
LKDQGIKSTEIDFKEIKKKSGYPSKERLSKGPVVVIECPEEIPCNPCETVCPKNVIAVGNPITNIPVFNEENCDGCGQCIPICPGLAIFLINNTYSADRATIGVPYEMMPLPSKGEIVDALDRNGNIVCDGEIIRIQNPKNFNRTAIVTFAIPKKYSEVIRNFKLKKRS